MRRFDIDTLDKRMVDYAKESSSFMFGVMKSITLAMACFALYNITVQIWNGDISAWLRVPVWCASLWIAWLTYNNVSAFSNLMDVTFSGWDSFILFAKTIIEFLLFQVLADGKAWYAWPLLHGLMAGIAHLKIRRYLRTLKNERYDNSLHSLLRFVREWTRKSDLPGTLGASLVFTIGGVALLWLYRAHIVTDWMDMYVYFFSILSFIPLRIASKTGDRLRAEILHTLESHQSKMRSIAA